MSLDIASNLLARVQESFNAKVKKSSALQGFIKLARDGKATHRQTQEYSIELGELASKALMEVLTEQNLEDGKLSYEIAEKVLSNVLGNNHDLVNTYAAAVQNAMNERAGIGLKAVAAELRRDRIEGIVKGASESETLDKARTYLDEPVKTFTQSCADDFMRTNFELAGEAGLSPRIVRTYENGCCEWCAKLAGTYEYPVSDRDVYRRHERCRCLVVYENGRLRQNVHTKRISSSEEREQRIAYAERVGADDREQFQTKKVGLQLLEQIAEMTDDSGVASDDIERLTNKAKSGLRHSGIRTDALNKTANQLRKSITSHIAQYYEHRYKIANHENSDSDWNKKSSVQQQGLLKKWRKDQTRNMEQAVI